MQRECKKCDNALQATHDRVAELQAQVATLKMNSAQLEQEARAWFQVAAHSLAELERISCCCHFDAVACLLLLEPRYSCALCCSLAVVMLDYSSLQPMSQKKHVGRQACSELPMTL